MYIHNHLVQDDFYLFLKHNVGMESETCLDKGTHHYLVLFMSEGKVVYYPYADPDERYYDFETIRELKNKL